MDTNQARLQEKSFLMRHPKNPFSRQRANELVARYEKENIEMIKAYNVLSELARYSGILRPFQAESMEICQSIEKRMASIENKMNIYRDVYQNSPRGVSVYESEEARQQIEQKWNEEAWTEAFQIDSMLLTSISYDFFNIDVKKSFNEVYQHGKNTYLQIYSIIATKWNELDNSTQERITSIHNKAWGLFNKVERYWTDDGTNFVEGYKDLPQFHREDFRAAAFQALNLIEGYIKEIQFLYDPLELRNANTDEDARKIIKNHILNELESKFSIEDLRTQRVGASTLQLSLDMRATRDNFIRNCQKLELFLHKVKETPREDEKYEELRRKFTQHNKRGLYQKSIVVFKEITIQAEVLSTTSSIIKGFYDKLQEIRYSCQKYEKIRAKHIQMQFNNNFNIGNIEKNINQIHYIKPCYEMSPEEIDILDDFYRNGQKLEISLYHSKNTSKDDYNYKNLVEKYQCDPDREDFDNKIVTAFDWIISYADFLGEYSPTVLKPFCEKLQEIDNGSYRLLCEQPEQTEQMDLS